MTLAPALVQGPDSAVTKAVVRALASGGRQVAVLGAVVREAALALAVDVPPQQVVATVEAELGPLGVLVCTVPRLAPAAFVGRDPGPWLTETLGQLTPTFALVRSAVPSLRQAAESGRIVVLGAGWTPTGQRHATAASAVHGALVAMVKTLARDLGPDGVTVNEVVSDVLEQPSAEAVARAVAYLCSPDAGAMVGQLLTVGSGGTLRP